MLLLVALKDASRLLGTILPFNTSLSAPTLQSGGMLKHSRRNHSSLREFLTSDLCIFFFDCRHLMPFTSQAVLSFLHGKSRLDSPSSFLDIARSPRLGD